MKTVRDFMRTDVIYFSVEDSVFDVAAVFTRQEISGAPVVENERVIGMVSISDVIRFMSVKLTDAEVIAHEPQSLSMLLLNLVKMGKEFVDFKKELERISKVKIKDIMSREVIYVTPDATLVEAASMMEKSDVNRLPVIHEGKLVGIITRSDLVKALIE